MTSFGRFLIGGFGFAVGFVLALAVVCALNIVYRGIWLPIGAAAIWGFALGWAPAWREGPARALATLAFGSGATAFWMLTTDPLPVSRGGKLVPTIAPMFLVLALFGLIMLIAAKCRESGGRRAALGWLIGLMVLGWAVAYFSSAKGGADPMIAWVRDHFGLSADSAATVVVIVRKAIHLTFYGLVGVVGWRLGTESGLDVRRALRFAVILALVLAAFDEMRQAGIAGRTGSPWDVLLDLVGAATFAGLLSARQVRRDAGANA